MNILKTLVGTDAHSSRLGRLERLEQALANEFRAHAVPTIADFNQGLRPLPGQPDPHPPTILGGIQCVLHQMTDHPLNPVFVPTGDIEADMAKIKAFYAPFKGKNASQFDHA